MESLSVAPEKESDSETTTNLVFKEWLSMQSKSNCCQLGSEEQSATRVNRGREFHCPVPEIGWNFRQRYLFARRKTSILLLNKMLPCCEKGTSDNWWKITMNGRSALKFIRYRYAAVCYALSVRCSVCVIPRNLYATARGLHTYLLNINRSTIYTLLFIAPDKWEFHILFFLISPRKYKLWVLIRSASPRRF